MFETKQKPSAFRSLRDCKRFWLKTTISWTSFYNGEPCWLWFGATNHDGYGIVIVYPSPFSVHSKVTIYAHRMSYESYVGPIPKNYTLDHLCRIRRCVNPAHLEAVPHIVNVMRGIHPTTINKAKTHCKRGHLLTGKNLIEHKDGRRECRTCSNISHLASYHRLYGKGGRKWRIHR